MKNLEVLQAINIHDNWVKCLNKKLPEGVMYQIAITLNKYREESVCIPERNLIFEPFKKDIDEIKVVIFDEEPYCVKDVSTGLAYESENPIYEPTALKNIKWELMLEKDGYIEKLNLKNWQEQGVFLYNLTPTVQEQKPRSHKDLWEPFTKAVLECLNEKEKLIYLLWGQEIKKYKVYIDPNKHYILECSHPSLKDNKKDWFLNNHFTETNNLLTYKIKWYE